MQYFRPSLSYHLILRSFEGPLKTGFIYVCCENGLPLEIS